MKNVLLLLIALLIGYQAESQSYSISGKVLYKKTPQPRTLDSTTVSLFRNDTLIQTFTTTTGGDYAFTNLIPGTYQMRCSCPKIAGGFGTNDALYILRNFCKMPPLLTGLNLKASDVTADGVGNAVDGMFCSMRFTGIIPSFPSGDWVFDEPVVIITSNSVIQTIYGLCYGDVNGSFSPIGSTNP